MKSLIIVFGTLLLIFAAPYIFAATDNAITEDYTQSIAGVVTEAEEYTANVTLGRDVYNDDSASILSISSNVSADSPTAASYNSVSMELEVSGLEADETRTLSIEFRIDHTTLATGMAMFITLFRWFYVFIIIGMAGGAIYAFFD